MRDCLQGRTICSLRIRILVNKSQDCLSVKTVLVDAVTGERPEPRRPLRNSFWYALVKSIERSEIFKSVVTSGSSDYWPDAEIASS